MILKNINHDYGYHTQKIATMFFALEKIKVDCDGDDDIVVETIKNGDEITVNARVYSKYISKSSNIGDDDGAHALSLLLYDTLCEVTCFNVPWGILYGVRPARLMHATAEKIGDSAAYQKFISDRVEPSKAQLALDVMHSENKIIALSTARSFSLYVSIPFCPTRCSYCSFVSHSIANAADLISPYVDLLCREIAENGKIAAKLGLRLETIYFGGGTPTTLSAEQLDKILTAVENAFDLSTLREYTVEAGRPDTVTEQKLNTLFAHNVGRISINPQTFNDAVRANVGRRHTTEQTIAAYNLARKVGFENINMDFIAGLNGDTFDLSQRNTAYNMIDYSAQKLSHSGYYPYYMYRQSKSLGNLENVGWCKSNKDCLYNVFMMDETHTVLAAGAGAVTKLKNPQTSHIERIYNFKYPYEYINDFQVLIDRKSQIVDFYNK